MAEELLTEAETISHVSKETFPTKFVFEILNQADLRYALLRGYDELRQDHKDIEIDLLVHPDEIFEFEEVVKQNGFVEMPSWGHAPHRFFVIFCRQPGIWIKLDVVTDIYFGHPFRHVKLDLVDSCIAQSRQEEVSLLSQDYEFLTTFLHCLLDKRRFDPKHCSRLQELMASLNENLHLLARLERHVSHYLSPTIVWQHVVQAVDSGDWNDLLKRRHKLERQLTERARLMCALNKMITAAGRKLRPLWFILRRHGVSLVLLAPDGAGKSTLSARLAQDWQLHARLIYMGTNLDSMTVALPTTPWLYDRLRAVRRENKRKTVYGVVIRALGFANTLIEHWYRCLYARYQLARGRFVVFDRFVYDAWIQPQKKSLWKRLRRFLIDAPCPTPDLVVLLDAPGEVLYARKQEHSPEWIDKQRAGYHKLRARLPQMVTVDAAQSAERVRCEVTDLIWKAYRAKYMKG